MINDIILIVDDLGQMNIFKLIIILEDESDFLFWFLFSKLVVDAACCWHKEEIEENVRMLKLRTFARNFSNIDFFLKLLPLKDDELAMSEM